MVATSWGGHRLVETEAACAGQAFYRAESAQARDLAVLAAAVYKQETGKLHVLDAMCGCGLRAKRYLLQVLNASLHRSTTPPPQHHRLEDTASIQMP